jgi:hypothetical protein
LLWYYQQCTKRDYHRQHSTRAASHMDAVRRGHSSRNAKSASFILGYWACRRQSSYFSKWCQANFLPRLVLCCWLCRRHRRGFGRGSIWFFFPFIVSTPYPSYSIVLALSQLHHIYPYLGVTELPLRLGCHPAQQAAIR